VSYDFIQWPVWATLWSVTGARKNYEIHSRYLKLTL